MSDRELGALGVDGLDVPGGEPRLGVGLECERHAPVLLGECVEGVRIGVAVDEDYGLLGMLHQRHQELERVKDLTLEEDLSASVPRGPPCRRRPARSARLLVLELPDPPLRLCARTSGNCLQGTGAFPRPSVRPPSTCPAPLSSRNPVPGIFTRPLVVPTCWRHRGRRGASPCQQWRRGT